MEKYAPELQEIITNSYIELYNNLTNNIDENKIYLYERSHESSIYVFLKELKKYYINLDEYESNMLKLKNIKHKFDLIIFIFTLDMDINLKRIIKRNNYFNDKIITKDYLQNLELLHIGWFWNFKSENKNVIMIFNNTSITELKKQIKNIFSQLI